MFSEMHATPRHKICRIAGDLNFAYKQINDGWRALESIEAQWIPELSDYLREDPCLDTADQSHIQKLTTELRRIRLDVSTLAADINGLCIDLNHVKSGESFSV